MKVAIMQPYLFPYIGYFQLIKAVDTFVIYDDVQYIRRGWINRNRLLNNGADYMFTLPVQKAPQDTLINATLWMEGHIDEKKKLLQLIQNFYKKAPYFNETFELLTEILNNTEQNVSKFNVYSLQKIAGVLGIQTSIILASSLDHNKETKAEERIIDVAKHCGASHYINAAGGTELYNPERFQKVGLELSFLKTQNVCYQQFKSDFIPFLSIIDVLMFNSKEQIQGLLEAFDLN